MTVHPNATLELSPHRQTGSKPRWGHLPPRCIVHTTETPSGTLGAVRRNLQWPYHLAVDVKQRRIEQWLQDLERTAFSLRSYWHSGVPNDWRKTNPYAETNHCGRLNIQVVLIGYARDMHRLSQEDLEWLALEVFLPIVEMGIPNRWDTTYRAGELKSPLASVWSPIRYDWDGWRELSGFSTHQRGYAQDHWDPGGLDVKTIESVINRRLEPEEEIPMYTDKQIETFVYKTKLVGGLKEGVQGVDDVVAGVQFALDRMGFECVVDGQYGPDTVGAVKAYEAAKGFKPDGFVSANGVRLIMKLQPVAGPNALPSRARTARILDAIRGVLNPKPN